MTSYLELLRKWGLNVEREDLMVPPAAPVTTYPIGFDPLIKSWCPHFTDQDFDLWWREPSGTTEQIVQLNNLCLHVCADKTSKHFPAYAKAISLAITAELMAHFESRDTSGPEAILDRVTLPYDARIVASQATAEAGLDLTQVQEERIKAQLAPWNGAEREYLIERYRIKVKPDSPDMYAAVTFGNYGLQKLFEIAFPKVSDGIYRLPGLASSRNVQPGTGFFKQMHLNYNSSDSEASYRMNLVVRVESAVELPEEAMIKPEEFDETFKVMNKTMDALSALEAAASFVRS